MGFGLPLCFIPVSVAALAGVEEREAGLASGLINTSQQIGGAISVAVASTVAAEHTKSFHAGLNDPAALTAGYRWAFWMLATIAAAAVVATLALIREEEIGKAPSTVPSPG
jgi:MFS family permease